MIEFITAFIIINVTIFALGVVLGIIITSISRKRAMEEYLSIEKEEIIKDDKR